MTDQPPSPVTPSATPTLSSPPADDPTAERIRLTTPQLAASLESALGTDVDESTLEDVLLELDRRGYVEWVTLTRHGAYVWDVTDAPERLGDAVATALLSSLESWLGTSSSTA